jgi:NDP-sugar pyrophosphorylase family protein
MVLAAGLGERMRPLTLVRAKPVLPVLNRPLLEWTLARLAKQGVTEAVVNLHYLPATVRRALGDGRRLGLRLRYSHEREILGTGGGVRQERRFFDDGPFVIVNGDVLFDFDLRALVREHRRSGAQATLALRRNPDPPRYGGVVVDRKSWVVSIAGRPKARAGHPWLFTGVHVLEPALLGRLPAGRSDSVRDLYIPMLAEGGRIRGLPLAGAWYDFGSPSLYLSSHMSLLDSGLRGVRPRAKLVHPEARIARGAVVERSVIGARCVLEPGARVVGSVLWDDVRVAAGAEVHGSIAASGARFGAGEIVRDAVVVPTRDGVLRAVVGA